MDPLVSCETLRTHPEWVVFDVRHHLTDAAWGPAQYAKGHIPGAFHAHVDRDLAGPVGDGRRGRHPLPLPGAFPRFLTTYGVSPDTPVVAYDDAGGAWAARLWWLARFYGHRHVAVLDGGWARWKAIGYPVSTSHERPRDGAFRQEAGQMPVLDADAVAAGLADGSLVLLDARAPARYRGEAEPVDPVAGHIPGARNLPYADLLLPDGRLRPAEDLRACFEAVDATDKRTVVSCGSGVTSALLVLAAEVAGLGTPALYPGSWSEWCRTRPAATGAEAGAQETPATGRQ